MNEQHRLFDVTPDPLPTVQRQQEISELVARYRVKMNQLVARMLYFERLFRRSSDGSAEMVGAFSDAFLTSCSTVPDNPEEWNGADCYTSEEIYEKVILMYRSARDLRRTAKKIVTIRRHFYRDLTILHQRHRDGKSGFDAKANLRIKQRRQWTTLERKAVWEKSNGQCFYCEVTLTSPAGDIMHVDHRVPVVAGGGDDLENLVAACIPCNLKKNAKSEDRFLEELSQMTKSSFSASLFDLLDGDVELESDD